NPKKILENLALAAHMAPNKLFQFGAKFVRGSLSSFILRLLRANWLKVNDIPIYLRRAVTQINGDKEVESVTIRNISANGELTGPEEQLDVDTVCLSGGLLPLIELLQVSNCQLIDIPELGGIVPLHNQFLKTTVDKIYV